MPSSDSTEQIEEIAEERELLEEIVEENGPFAPEARALFRLIDQWERGEL